MAGTDWPVFPREHYLERLRSCKDTPFTKVITGLRRSGKSTIMDIFRAELIDSGIGIENILYLNLENDDEDIPADHRSLTDLVRSKIDVGKGRYLFFDEIQNVNGNHPSERSITLERTSTSQAPTQRCCPRNCPPNSRGGPSRYV